MVYKVSVLLSWTRSSDLNSTFLNGFSFSAIITELKKALSSNILGKISSFLNLKNIKKFKNKLDPRLYNELILLA